MFDIKMVCIFGCLPISKSAGCMGDRGTMNPWAQWDGGSTEELAERNKSEVRVYHLQMIYNQLIKNHDFPFHLFVSSDKIYFSIHETKKLRPVTFVTPKTIIVTSNIEFGYFDQQNGCPVSIWWKTNMFVLTLLWD